MLETEVLVELNRNRTFDVMELSQVDVNQFYGIEIEEFPVRIAEIALWMMDHIMNMRLSEALGGYFPRFPLKASPAIKNADALEIDWTTVLDPAQCTYVLGNPPFGGSKFQTDAQRTQITRLAALKNKKGSLDYVASWFIKAGAYIRTLRPRLDLLRPTRSLRASRSPSCGHCFSNATISRSPLRIGLLPGAAKREARPMFTSSSSG